MIGVPPRFGPSPSRRPGVCHHGGVSRRQLGRRRAPRTHHHVVLKVILASQLCLAVLTATTVRVQGDLAVTGDITAAGTISGGS